MPIYEYNCTNCFVDYETIQKVSDSPLTKCPECENETLVKKTSMSAFHLKGGGWYKDGYGQSSSTDKENTSQKNSTQKESTPKAESASTKTGEKSAKSTESTKTKAKAS